MSRSWRDDRLGTAREVALPAGTLRYHEAGIWRAGEEHVFPLAHATAYAERLGVEVQVVPDSYTYVAEDQPEFVARRGLARWQP